MGAIQDICQRIDRLRLCITTYEDLSPDLQMRRSINQFLGSRPALNRGEWYRQFWYHRGVEEPIAQFVYTFLEQVSGLQVARIWPSDRLEKDLCLSLVCWFDWCFQLCDAFSDCFEVDISTQLKVQELETIADLMLFLNNQIH